MSKSRLDAISAECGLSTDIVRRVLEAQKNVAVDSLLHGEKVIITGLCAIVPMVKSTLTAGVATTEVKAKAIESASLLAELKNHKAFETREEFDEELEAGVRTLNISL